MREKHRTEEREIRLSFFFSSSCVSRISAEEDNKKRHGEKFIFTAQHPSKQTSKNKKIKCNESNKNRSKFDSLLQRLVDDVANTKWKKARWCCWGGIGRSIASCCAAVQLISFIRRDWAKHYRTLRVFSALDNRQPFFSSAQCCSIVVPVNTQTARNSWNTYTRHKLYRSPFE